MKGRTRVLEHSPYFQTSSKAAGRSTDTRIRQGASVNIFELITHIDTYTVENV
jgi:hypothetical protein